MSLMYTQCFESSLNIFLENGSCNGSESLEITKDQRKYPKKIINVLMFNP